MAINYRDLEFTFGDRLGKALKAAGISNNELADRLQVNRVTVSNWINDRTRPHRRELNAILEILGISEDWLFTGKVPQLVGGGTYFVGPVGIEPTTHGLVDTLMNLKRSDYQLCA